VILADRIHLVGSGSFGFDMTDQYDCHIYLVDGGSELALIDVGAGMGVFEVVENVRKAGFEPERVRQILCTHAHGDHAGGAARLRALLPDAALSVSGEAADWVRRGDEVATSVAFARAAGIYPLDYHLEPCPVDRELADGDLIRVGDLELECIATPGHADGHISFLMDHDDVRSLFVGDLVFHGGTVLLQNTRDARLGALIESLRRLRGSRIDALFPGHFSFSLREGQRHIERANGVLDTLLIPPQAVSAW
jgi:glyoxylase-like metal-dependent hydrolase (beta-lactamase superfamily II)